MIENLTVTNDTLSNSYIADKTTYSRDNIYSGRVSISSTVIYLIAEGGETFINYITRHGLNAESGNLLVLPSNHHYYYDRKDLRGIKTVINLRELNFVKDLNAFLYNLHDILSPDAYFVGCFSSYQTQTSESLLSRFINKVNNFLDARTYHNLDMDDALKLLESHGFRVSDLSEINGLTYFFSQNICQPVTIRT
jgi:hypothetical protein